MIEISFTPVAADYKQTQIYMQRKALGTRRFFAYTIGMALGVAMLSAALVIFSLMVYDETIPELARINISVTRDLLLVGLMGTFLLRFLMRRTIDRCLINPHSALLSNHIMTMNEYGFTLKNSQNKIELAWAAVQEIHLTKELLLILTKSSEAFFIPRRIAQTEAELDQLIIQIDTWRAGARVANLSF